MCTESGALFVAAHLSAGDVAHRQVVEVGSCDPVGTVREIVMPLGPADYVGVDMAAGPGVDVLCPAERLIRRFGPSSFDVVISTETLEHVQNWQLVVHNMKGVLSEHGLLVLTTRSRGFEFHPYPMDFWRFEVDDMAEIFGDLEIEALERDEDSPGVFIRARRRDRFRERDLSRYPAYSIVRRRRADRATPADVAGARLLGAGKTAAEHTLPLAVRTATRRVINRWGTRHP